MPTGPPRRRLPIPFIRSRQTRACCQEFQLVARANSKLAVVDAAGNEVGPGVVGYLKISGAAAGNHYVSPVTATSSGFTSGGFVTTDLGRLRKDDEFEVIGRSENQPMVNRMSFEHSEVISSVDDELLALLRSAWLRVLAVESLSEDSDVFAAGANSLMCLSVQSELIEHGVDAELRHLYDRATLIDQCAAICAGAGD